MTVDSVEFVQKETLSYLEGIHQRTWKNVLELNVEQKDLQGEVPITREHMQNNQSVRQMLGERGIRPEELPAAEDIRKVERRVASNEKNIEKTTQKLPPSKSWHYSDNQI